MAPAALMAQPASQPAVDLSHFGPDFFPILPWDAQHGWLEPFMQREEGLASIAECNFTMAGFVQPSDLPLCERLGLAAIVAPAAEGMPWFGPWKDLNDEQIEQRIKTMVATVGKSRAVMGYFITDEPGTALFPALGKVVAAIRKHDPGRLAYINLFPGYATIGAPDSSQLGAASYREYLERFVAEVKPQMLSYDNYMVQMSNDGDNAEALARYFNDLMEVRRVAHANGLKFWNVVSSNQIQADVPPPSPSNLLFQACTTLAAGGSGVSWYTYYFSSVAEGGYAYAPMDKQGLRTATWGYLQLVNHQLRKIGPLVGRLSSKGVYCSAPIPAPSLPPLPGGIVEHVVALRSALKDEAATLPVMVGEFKGPEDSDHIMLVNLSLHRSAYVKYRTHKPYPNSVLRSHETGKPTALGANQGIWLPAGQGVLNDLK